MQCQFEVKPFNTLLIMATANFSVINANSYYAIMDSYEDENGETIERDDWAWEDTLEFIREDGTESGLFPSASTEWNSRMDARELCESTSNWATFGNGKAWTTETNVESLIVFRSGYYEGGVLDYDIKVETCMGDAFHLSDYDSVDELVEDYLDTLMDEIEWKGMQHKWNVGTFKMQKKNIRKWIEKRIDNEVEKCEKFCKENCDIQLGVYARFGNGETMYCKVG